MMRMTSMVMTLASGAFQAGCAGVSPIDDPELQLIDRGAMSPADIHLNIAGLGPCTDNAERSLQLDSKQPVHVLVHGCFGSSGRFRGLAQVFAYHGQQAICFTYNDRDSLMRSSGQLTAALDQLGRAMQNQQITVIGHSQGALIARKALVAERPDSLRNGDAQLRLVTVSGPFSGIASAEACGNPLTRALSLGLIAPLCKIATGDKWSDITYSSEFILQPGTLLKQVSGYLKVDTDESGSCRRFDNAGACKESDTVFSLGEQRNAAIDRDPVARVVNVKAGHVEIVGDERIAPVKLIAVLQQNGILNRTEPQRSAGLDVLLAKLYGQSSSGASTALDQSGSPDGMRMDLQRPERHDSP